MVYRLERGKCCNWHAAAQLRMAYVAFELSPLLPKDEPPTPPAVAISTLSPAVADFKRELDAWEVNALDQPLGFVTQLATSTATATWSSVGEGHCVSMLEEALAYLARDWAVLPSTRRTSSRRTR